MVKQTPRNSQHITNITAHRIHNPQGTSCNPHHTSLTRSNSFAPPVQGHSKSSNHQKTEATHSMPSGEQGKAEAKTGRRQEQETKGREEDVEAHITKIQQTRFNPHGLSFALVVLFSARVWLCAVLPRHSPILPQHGRRRPHHIGGCVERELSPDQ